MYFENTNYFFQQVMHCTGSFVELFVIIYIHVVKQPKKQDITQVTGARCVQKKPKKLTRVHSVIFVISLKLNIFPFSASILTFSTQNHLILIQPIFSINTIISTRPATRRHFLGYCTSWNFTYLASMSLRLKSVSCLVFPPIWIVSRDMNLNVHKT